MSVVSRGVRNAFRNGMRTSAVVLILAISIGLSLSMLVAYKAVEGRIAEMKTEVDRTVVINPAGARGFEGGGEPLTVDDVTKAQQINHVQSAYGYMNVVLQTEGQDNNRIVMKMGPDGQEPGKTNLESPTEAGTLGKRFNTAPDGTEMPDIKLPVQGLATNGSFNANGKAFNLTDGRLLKEDDTYSAVLGKALAEKNNLSVGSTFTAYEKTFTVVGIIDQGNEFENAQFIIPLKTAQELTGLANEVTVIVAQVDSIDNLEAVITSLKETLGTDKADVTSSQENVRQAIESLKSVQNISIVGFAASLAAASAIVLMVMFVIVRERRREIGVLKAIGGSNRTIVSQFIVEAIVLVAISGVLGLGAAFAGSGAIANALVSSNTSSASSELENEQPSAGGPTGGGFKRSVISVNGSGDDLKDTTELVGKVTTNVGASTLLYGFLGMIAIAILGSAIPAWLIAKVRPAEVLRGE